MSLEIYRSGVQQINNALLEYGTGETIGLLQYRKGVQRERPCKLTRALLRVDESRVFVSRMETPAIGWDPFKIEGLPEHTDPYLRNVRFLVGVYQGGSRKTCYAFKGQKGYIQRGELGQRGREMTEMDLQEFSGLFQNATPVNA